MAKGFKTGGRQIGSQNKINALIRQRISDFVQSESEYLIENIHELTISERARLFIALSRLIIAPPEREQPYVEPPTIVIHGNL